MTTTTTSWADLSEEEEEELRVRQAADDRRNAREERRRSRDAFRTDEFYALTPIPEADDEVPPAAGQHTHQEICS